MKAPENASMASYGTVRAGDVAMLDVRRKDGSGEVIRYSHLIRLSYSTDRLLSLVATDCIITLEGAGLDSLRERLQRQEVAYLQEGGTGPGDMRLERVSVAYAGEA